jgi:hypothetical protein
MTTTVCLAANTLQYIVGGGHLWVYLNWALGLLDSGCEVIWLEVEEPGASAEKTTTAVASLRKILSRFGISDSIVFVPDRDRCHSGDLPENCLKVEEVGPEVDLLLAVRYDLEQEVVSRFRRSAMIDIDPGILQFWMGKGEVVLASFDVFFTIGETVGQPGAKFGSGGVQWEYTPPCVDLHHWKVHGSVENSAFTTVSHWFMDSWMEDESGVYCNDKRSGFMPFLNLPQLSSQPLELALQLAGDNEEQTRLEELGWRVSESHEVASNPWDFRKYIQNSLGEFSCVKPSCVRLENAWISDRTLCYLASGKPAIVQHTGASQFLPDAEGVLRFRNLEEAVRCLDLAARTYDRQCRLARKLAEEIFDAGKVTRSVLERTLL